MTLDPSQYLTLCLATIAGLVVVWVAFLLSLRQHPELLREVFNEGFVLRMLTIAFIVASTSILVIGKVATPEFFTILSGIAGFVLGGIPRPSTKDKKDTP